jgi:class 3 adenylate cyclase
MGDACLAVFPEDRCADAVDCAIELTSEPHPVPGAGPGLVAGANVHLGTVAEGALGAGAYDVVGAEVNNLFRMGSGPGVRISDAVYHKLPPDSRTRWHEQSRPLIYAFDPRVT